MAIHTKCGFVPFNNNGKQDLESLATKLTRKAMSSKARYSTNGSLPTGTIKCVIYDAKLPGETYLSEQQINDQLNILSKGFKGKLTQYQEDLHNIFASHQGTLDITFTKEAAIKKEYALPEPYKSDENFANQILNKYLDIKGSNDLYSSKEYIHIFVMTVDPIDDGVTLGFATYPNQFLYDNFIFINRVAFYGTSSYYTQNLGRTLVHEMGHFCGLPHIWGTNDTIESDDGILDTPLQSGPTVSTASFDPVANPPQTYGSLDMYVNHMDYTREEYRSLFTNGQITVMADVLCTHEDRKHLLRAENGDSLIPYTGETGNCFSNLSLGWKIAIVIIAGLVLIGIIAGLSSIR